MRLTLRTMLAYLDDILDPADAQDLGRKVEESEFATSLVGRIRDVSRRLRLGAPKLTGRGMGLDPNTVAEYLDNTLSVARVPEFEKVCLESDMHLAEVACSHQILALVLGSPAEVDPASRQRMYKLLPRPSTETYAVGAAVAERPEPRHAPRPKAEVPDYLRDDTPWLGGWLKIAAAALVLVGLGVAVWMAVGPTARTPVAVVPPDENGAGAAQPQPEQPDRMPAGARAGEQPSRDEAGPAMDDVDRGAADPVAAPSPRHGDERDADDSSALDTDEMDARDLEANVGDVDRSTPPDLGASRPRPAGAPPATDDQLDDDANDQGDSPLPSRADAIPRDEEDATDKVAEDEANDEQPAAAQREAVGRFISAVEVLLRYENDETGWSRLTGQQTISVGDQLLSLPTFRSTIALSAGVAMQLAGDTRVRFAPPVTVGIPSVAIDYGRLVLMTAGRPGSQVSISAGDLRGTITLVDAASVVGVEVRPTRPEGSNPETEPRVYQLDLYVASGEVVWMDAAQQAPETLSGPQHWSWPAAVAPEAAASVPAWVLDSDEIQPIDRKASQTLAQSFVAGRPARLELKQLAEDRRSEVRRLAVRCLASIDNYDLLVKSLSDKEKRYGWEQDVDALWGAMAQSPESAARVRTALERQFGARGTQLNRVLWGYNEAMLKGGAASELVEYLADDSNLELRVVAFCTLQRIADKGLAYRPTDPPKTRQSSLQKWRQWAEAYQASPPASTAPTGL